jgi:hypothetical protein
MMNFFCPNGSADMAGAGLIIGLVATIIWTSVDPRFRRYPDDPVSRMNYLNFGKLVIVLGGGAGFMMGLALNQFISFKC